MLPFGDETVRLTDSAKATSVKKLDTTEADEPVRLKPDTTDTRIDVIRKKPQRPPGTRRNHFLCDLGVLPGCF